MNISPTTTPVAGTAKDHDDSRLEWVPNLVDNDAQRIVAQRREYNSTPFISSEIGSACVLSLQPRSTLCPRARAKLL
eukprot:scaffold50234_cov63-Phaeocystis_antarctica.AAC.1